MLRVDCQLERPAAQQKEQSDRTDARPRIIVEPHPYQCRVIRVESQSLKVSNVAPWDCTCRSGTSGNSEGSERMEGGGEHASGATRALMCHVQCCAQSVNCFGCEDEDRTGGEKGGSERALELFLVPQVAVSAASDSLPESRSAPCALRPPLPTSDLRLKPLPLLLDTTYTNAAHFSPTHSLSCATQRLDHPPSGATLAPFHRRPSTASACLLAFLSARTAYTGSPAYKESAYTHTPIHTHARLCVHARTGSIATAHLSNSA